MYLSLMSVGIIAISMFYKVVGSCVFLAVSCSFFFLCFVEYTSCIHRMCPLF